MPHRPVRFRCSRKIILPKTRNETGFSGELFHIDRADVNMLACLQG